MNFDIPIASSGTNRIKVKSGKDTYSFRAINWNISVPEKSVYKTVDMKKIFNDKVSNIFAYGKYMFPRWKYTTYKFRPKVWDNGVILKVFLLLMTVE